MKNTFKQAVALLLLLSITISCLSAFTLNASGGTVDYVYSGKYIYNWGEREEEATFLSPNALKFYTGNNTYALLASLQGGTSTSTAPSSALYSALQKLMKDKHTKITSYAETRPLYQYTDCENSGGRISSFYSGDPIGPAWDSGSTWNREHTWPNSKGLGGSDENDIMMLRPTATSENGSRGNKAYGQSSGYYFPNTESNGAHDVRGDVARIFLYVYVRWGNVNGNGEYTTWGTRGVMESLDVLLTWMEEDPVDTWELGRNDSVESITGTRNVFVDYPEFAFLLFGEEIPADMTTPSGEAKDGSVAPDPTPDTEQKPDPDPTPDTTPDTTPDVKPDPDPTPDTDEPKDETLTSETISAYMQVRTRAGKQDLRLIFVCNKDVLYNFDKLTVSIDFTLKDGSKKAYHGTLGIGSNDFTLFYTVTADGDTFRAAEGCLLFGRAIVEIPENTVQNATITLKDSAGNALLLGNVPFEE